MDRRYLLLLLLIAALCFWLAPSLGTAPKAPAPVNHSTSSLFGRPSVSVAFINTVLSAYLSPAANSGQALYDGGVRFGVDPAYALAFFLHESVFGTRGVASVTHSLGNIICAGYPSCYGRYRSYETWSAGFLDWYQLITGPLYKGRGLTTLEQIIPVYAPASENNVTAYISAVRSAVSSWRLGHVEVQ